uniref:Calpain_III domain-containing protein n=1 Tax=Macrostomum lignano TaxID=282301 RepID=A0A1I8JJS8_9PLAT
IYAISDTDLNRVTRRDLLELKIREQLERRLNMASQLTHRSVFTTGSVTELLVLQNGSFLIILETGVPGDEADFCLSVFTSSNSRLMPFQNIVDTSFEYGGGHPDACIRCREFLPVLNE